MVGGYTGKILFVDLSIGTIEEEVLDEKMRHDFIGGCGIGARILYSRQKSWSRSTGTGKYTRHDKWSADGDSRTNGNALCCSWQVALNRGLGRS